MFPIFATFNGAKYLSQCLYLFIIAMIMESSAEVSYSNSDEHNFFLSHT